jgi:hypothetical protein
MVAFLPVAKDVEHLVMAQSAVYVEKSSRFHCQPSYKGELAVALRSQFPRMTLCFFRFSLFSSLVYVSKRLLTLLMN